MKLGDDGEGGGFLWFGVGVEVFIALQLLRQWECHVSLCVESGIWPVTRPKGLCHMVNGGADCSFIQLLDVFLRVCGLAHCLGDGTDDGVSVLWFVDGGEEWVVGKLDLAEELSPPPPAASSLMLIKDKEE